MQFNDRILTVDGERSSRIVHDSAKTTPISVP